MHQAVLGQSFRLVGLQYFVFGQTPVTWVQVVYLNRLSTWPPALSVKSVKSYHIICSCHLKLTLGMKSTGVHAAWEQGLKTVWDHRLII